MTKGQMLYDSSEMRVIIRFQGSPVSVPQHWDYRHAWMFKGTETRNMVAREELGRNVNIQIQEGN